jgi:hypothetical protein
MTDRDDKKSGEERAGENIRRRQAISVLRARLAAAEHTWGKTSGLDRKQMDKMEHLVEERRQQSLNLRREITVARRHLEELIELERRTRAELAGYERGLEALLSDAISAVDAASMPTWTPVPVIGYRVWTIAADRLRGARAVWDRPEMTAQCRPVPGAIGEVDGVPHSDGRCGRLGCGVYAVKEPSQVGRPHARIPAESRPGLVAGAVALTGKVVEHEHGYRAEHAVVVAAGALWRGTVVFGVSRRWLERLFASPVAALTDAAALGASTEAGAGRSRSLLMERLFDDVTRAARQYQQNFTEGSDGHR